MPRIIPEPRYFSIRRVMSVPRFLGTSPCTVGHGAVIDPFADAVIHSPAEITAAWPTTVTSSRWPRALIRQDAVAIPSLWYVTRSTRPARTSRLDGSICGFMRIVASSVPSPRAPFGQLSSRTQFGTMAQLDRRWQATTVEKRSVGRGSNPVRSHRVGIHRAVVWPVNERSAMMLSA